MGKQLRPDIAEAKKYLGFMAWGSYREVNKLEDYMRRGEEAIAIASGKFGGGWGILALTNERVIFLKDGWLKKNVQDFSLARVSSVEWQAGLFRGSLEIFGDGVEETITNVWAFTGSKVRNLIQDHMGRMPSNGYPTGQNYPSQGYQQPYTAPAPQQAPVAPAAPIIDHLAVMQDKLTRLEAARKQHGLPASQVDRMKQKILDEYERSTQGG